MTLFASKGRAGRPRKQGVPRNPKTGRIASGHDRQSPEAITATAEEARIRQLLGVPAWQRAKRSEKAMLEARKKVSGQLQGYPLGILYHTRQISRDQHDAGGYFAELWNDWARAHNVSTPNIRAIDYGRVQGLSTHPDMSEGWKRDVDRRWEKVQAALFNANGDHGRTVGDIYEILKRCLVSDIGPLNAYELGNLRVGLNAVKQASGV